MSGGRNIPYPRGLVPPKLGRRVRKLREKKKWSQERLARAVGVSRKTISRLERDVMPHVPGSDLVHALERALGITHKQRLVKRWHPPADEGSFTLEARAKLARRTAGLSLVSLSKKSGVSIATLSRFERGLGGTVRILKPAYGNAYRIDDDDYAKALGFLGAREMDAYCDARDPKPLLRLAAERLAKADTTDGSRLLANAAGPSRLLSGRKEP